MASSLPYTNFQPTSLLSALAASLDTLLLLELHLQVSERLLKAQRDSRIDGNPEQPVIIDAVSVERNHLLVRLCLMGGPNERYLPPRLLCEVSDWRIVTGGAQIELVISVACLGSSASIAPNVFLPSGLYW
ncbi:unnamed protein product [Protopolystoma xenopodis]|uniref:BROMI C-terminal Rab TBC-like domain-containing protein n=1 Tax=Protopolystoma xenopodis TaxID=117903 RepID=A0A3S5CEY5_9PLAT|nr:unnamed protein product [Protopolystoma xenopodis]